MDEFWVADASNKALDLYVKYMEYDNNFDGEYDEIDNEELRWDFIDMAVEFFQAITGRNVSDELAERS